MCLLKNKRNIHSKPIYILYKWAELNALGGQFSPTGHMFDTPGSEMKLGEMIVSVNKNESEEQ